MPGVQNHLLKHLWGITRSVLFSEGEAVAKLITLLSRVVVVAKACQYDMVCLKIFLSFTCNGTNQ